ncbi:hypothetical protein ACRU3B_18230 [Mycobacterium colombiense]
MTADSCRPGTRFEQDAQNRSPAGIRALDAAGGQSGAIPAKPLAARRSGQRPLCRDSDGLDDDGDLGDPDATGRAVVMCRVETLGVRFRFCPNLDDAMRLAEQRPCATEGCLGGHTVVHRDDRGHLRIVPAADDVEVIGRLQSVLRVREMRRQARARANEARRQQRRRAAKRAGDNDHDD